MVVTIAIERHYEQANCYKKSGKIKKYFFEYVMR